MKFVVRKRSEGFTTRLEITWKLFFFFTLNNTKMDEKKMKNSDLRRSSAEERVKKKTKRKISCKCVLKTFTIQTSKWTFVFISEEIEHHGI